MIGTYSRGATRSFVRVRYTAPNIAFERRSRGQPPQESSHSVRAWTAFADSYGLMCFQEDVMQAARDFAGFTMGEADVLRKGVGKKNPEFIAKQKPMFYEGGQQPRIRVTFDRPILFDGEMT